MGRPIGRPSVSLKTPAIKEALNPLARFELEAKHNYEAAEQEYAAALAIHEGARAAIRDKMKKAAKGNKDADDIADLKSEHCNLTPPDAPIWCRYKTNETTIEKCNEVMRDNPRGLLLFRDELVGLLAGWERPGHESDRGYFLEGWNGNQGHTDGRIGPRDCLCRKRLYLALQRHTAPKLQAYLYQCMRGLQNDGLMQRLQLAVYADELTSWQ